MENCSPSGVPTPNKRARRHKYWIARIAPSRVVVSGKDADPLSVLALFLGVVMAVLLIVLLVTVGLAFRAGVWGRRWSAADSESVEDTGLIDTCARTFTLVLMSLIGLFALGITYGNVLGAGAH
ncbi:MAG: hypothetical protein QOG08_996 [Chloroflexota bacterium]|nr:hypothetical protein [Chloroflexota bacterium]